MLHLHLCSQPAPAVPLGSPAVTPGHYLFAWSGEGGAAAAAGALGRPDAWPYVLPAQLAPGDLVPVATADWSGARRLALARVTAVEAVQGEGVFMPHTLTGAPHRCSRRCALDRTAVLAGCCMRLDGRAAPRGARQVGMQVC